VEPWGIGFSLFVVIVAALNLVLDFDMIESGVQGGGHRVHGVVRRVRPDGHTHWLYLEILRLLGKAPPQISETIDSRAIHHRKAGPHKPFLSKRFGYAAELHLAASARKGQRPGHTSATCSALRPSSFSMAAVEDEVIAALLHDAVEDQGGLPRLDEIREKFGVRVARIVAGCPPTLMKSPAKKRDWGERKRAYIEKGLRMSPVMSGSSPPQTKLANAREILSDYHAEGDAVFDRFNRPQGTARSGTTVRWSTYSTRQVRGPLIDELDRIVTELRTPCHRRAAPLTLAWNTCAAAI